jgi:hypothetical protein
LGRPFSFGQTGMTYVAPLRRFLLVGWRYPRLERETWNVRSSVWDLYEAPAPWGPWRCFASKEWDTGLYNPTIPTRSISNDGLHLWALACGCFDTWGDPPEKTLYTLLMLPISLSLA